MDYTHARTAAQRVASARRLCRPKPGVWSTSQLDSHISASHPARPLQSAATWTAGRRAACARRARGAGGCARRACSIGALPVGPPCNHSPSPGADLEARVRLHQEEPKVQVCRHQAGAGRGGTASSALVRVAGRSPPSPILPFPPPLCRIMSSAGPRSCRLRAATSRPTACMGCQAAGRAHLWARCEGGHAHACVRASATAQPPTLPRAAGHRPDIHQVPEKQA